MKKAFGKSWNMPLLIIMIATPAGAKIGFC